MTTKRTYILVMAGSLPPAIIQADYMSPQSGHFLFGNHDLSGTPLGIHRSVAMSEVREMTSYENGEDPQEQSS